MHDRTDLPKPGARCPNCDAAAPSGEPHPNGVHCTFCGITVAADRWVVSHRERIARVLDREGVWCGECSYEPGTFYDRCPVCRTILDGCAAAVIAISGPSR